MKLKPNQGLFQFDFNDSHAFLGVSIDADNQAIRQRYKEIARLMHPDSARWTSLEERNLGIKLFSSLVTHAYGQLSRSSQLQEQQTMLELLGKRVIAEAQQVDFSGPAAKSLYQESSARVFSTYEKLIAELAQQQYQRLSDSVTITGQISELNLVYLLRRQPGGNAGSAASVSSNPSLATETSPSRPIDVVKAKTAESAKLSQIENALRRAEEYINMKNWVKANLELREVLKEDPQNAKAHAHIAIVYFRQNQATMAKMHINKALQIAPQDPVVKQAKQELKKLMSDGSSSKAATDKGKLFSMFGKK